MHGLTWSDLRHVLAVGRRRSLAAAGRQLGVDPTTVARRLRAIEQALEVRLFERSIEGAMQPTQAGEIAVRHAEAMEAEVGSLTASVAGADAEVAGSVRVTAVPLLISRVLVPAALDLVTKHPSLRLELVAESRNLNLTRREADVALRFARPDPQVGSRILARRIGTLAYAAYASVASEADAGDLPWVTYEEGTSHLPPARWIERARQRGDSLSAVGVSDAEALLQAVQAGLGRSLLPCIVGDHVPQLRRVPTAGNQPTRREIWLLTHPDLRHLARVVAVTAWIERTIRGLAEGAASGSSAPVSMRIEGGT